MAKQRMIEITICDQASCLATADRKRINGKATKYIHKWANEWTKNNERKKNTPRAEQKEERIKKKAAELGKTWNIRTAIKRERKNSNKMKYFDISDIKIQ